MKSGFDVAFHIRLICDDLRKCVCWVLSESDFDQAVVDRLLSAYRAMHDMQIKESPLFIFDGAGITKGAVSDDAALVQLSAVRTPVKTFLINDTLLELIDGDTFLDKLLDLNSALDTDSDEFQLLLSMLDEEHGLHCVAAQ